MQAIGLTYPGWVLLALDTATEVVTVAVHDGARVVAHRTGTGARRHAEALVPLVSAALVDAGVAGPRLEAIWVGVGPGAYTGLRVGLATAQALGVVWAVPVHGACSLDALAVQAVGEQPARCSDGVLVVTDARRRQVFWARYGPDGARVDGPAVDAPADVPHRELPSVGSGALAHPELFPSAMAPATPDASWLAQGVLEGIIGPEPPTPLYLRRPDVTVGSPPKAALPPGRPVGR